MDWKAYARTGELFIKRFEEEKSITVHILVDRSSSMDFGKNNKYDYAAKLGLAIAYMVGNTNDRFRFSVFSETVTDISSARRNPNLAEMVDTLNSLRKTPDSMVEKCLTEYASRIQNKSLVVVISDFLVEPEEVESGLASLRNTDTVLVNVLDETELSPDIHGDKILKDPESDSRIRTYLSGQTRKDYREKLDRHTGRVEEAAEKNGAHFLQLSTGQNFFESFLDVWHLMNQ